MHYLRMESVAVQFSSRGETLADTGLLIMNEPDV